MSTPSERPPARRGRPRAERSGARATARPTQRDIAEAAGVSQAIVSIVLNDRSGTTARVGDATRARVQDAIERLGYQPDPIARRLAGQRNRLLGVHTFEPIFPTDTRDFYYPFLIGVEEQCQELGYDLLLFTSIKTRADRRVYDQGINRLRLADATILLGRGDDPADWAKLVADRYPFVFFGRREDVDGRGVPYVTADYRAAAAEAVGRLLDAGHTRVALVNEHPGNEASADLAAGYADAHAAHGLRPDPAGELRAPVGELPADAVPALLDGGFTAVAVRDLRTLELLADALAEVGVAIPADLSAVELGDPAFDVSRRDWSGFRVPRREIGHEAVARLVERLDVGPDCEPASSLVPCEPRAGETIAPPRERG